MSGWRRLAEGLAGYLWPAPDPCPGCGRPGRRPAGPGRLCRLCLQRLPLLAPPFCRRCGKPLRLQAALQAECRDCAARDRDFRVARAAGLYDGELRRLLHRFKFRRERRLAAPLGALLAEAWGRHAELHGGELLVPVPLAPERLADRGFNQAADLARVLGQAVHRPVAEDALLRQGGGAAQSRRSAAGRAAVGGAFHPLHPAEVSGRQVVLVDDVLTTGATAEACALALLRSGALSVDVLTVATTVVTDWWRVATETRLGRLRLAAVKEGSPMELRNCIRCGKVFMYVSKRVCPACLKEMDEIFERVRAYVKAHPGATVLEIADALEIEEQLVNEFVREGRFDVVTEAITVFCERCGKPIHRGRLCEQCAVELDKEIRSALPKKPEEPAPTKEREQHRLYLADHIVDKRGDSR
ncbi:MAG: double zinc ribbon domain-containing protein [Bacillota bacterium]|nr:double zinc ribbon domain-containing protein [Bacillota bacterium]